MTDRELLELAAKAAGYDIGFSTDYARTGIDGEMPYLRPSGNEWQPLADDGDALRLAVALGNRWRVMCLSVGAGQSACEFIYVPHDGDPGAATRRAIVLAAARIGKTMP